VPRYILLLEGVSDALPNIEPVVGGINHMKGQSLSGAARRLTRYAAACGWTLARAHARSGDRIAIASYLGGGTVFEEAISDFAEAYADQNERDYDEMVGAVKAGRLAVEAGV